MKTMDRNPRHVAAGDDARPETSGATVLGWLLLCFAVAPLAMAAASYGAHYLWAGGALVLAGAVLVLIGRDRRSRDSDPGR